MPPRTLLITDCALRSLTFATLGVLAVTDQLTLPVLIIGLLFGATFRMAGSSSRRLLATSMAGETGRFAANGLLGLNSTFALWTTGSMVAAPLGLMAAGPLIELAGTSGGLVLSGVLTLLLLPIAALAVLIRTPTPVALPARNVFYG